MKDGCHEILGRVVYIDDGVVKRALVGSGLIAVTGYVYRRDGNGWEREYHVTPGALRKGITRGTKEIF